VHHAATSTSRRFAQLFIYWFQMLDILELLHCRGLRPPGMTPTRSPVTRPGAAAACRFGLIVDPASSSAAGDGAVPAAARLRGAGTQSGIKEALAGIAAEKQKWEASCLQGTLIIMGAGDYTAAATRSGQFSVQSRNGQSAGLPSRIRAKHGSLHVGC
jgi:hypothetical protein